MRWEWLRDSSSQSSIKGYAMTYSKESGSHGRRNRRPVILCCCWWTNVWVHTSAVNQNYSTLAASDLEVLCDISMLLCNVSAFITFIMPVFQNSYYGAFGGFVVRYAHDSWIRDKEASWKLCRQLCRFFFCRDYYHETTQPCTFRRYESVS